jgi:hypothetical protein
MSINQYITCMSLLNGGGNLYNSHDLKQYRGVLALGHDITLPLGKMSLLHIWIVSSIACVIVAAICVFTACEYKGKRGSGFLGDVVPHKLNVVL